MKQTHNTISNITLSPIAVPAGLEAKVLTRIAFEKRKSFKVRALWSGTVSIISLATTTAAGISLYHQAVQSGLTEYLSLLFSDAASITTYWKEFTLLVAQSLPAIGSILALISLAVLIASLAIAIRNTKYTLIYS